jgi:putative transposase
MSDIMVLFACLSQCLDRTTMRQLARVSEAMLAMSGRVTMRGIARWAGQGGSYRTIQRFFTTSLSWGTVQWVLIRHHLLEPDDVIVLGGDDVVVTKSGKQTHGLERFFSSLYGKAVPGLCFLSVSLISVNRRTSYPALMEQHGPEHRHAPAEVGPKKAESKRGRPKGSKNQHRREVTLSPYLCFVQESIRRVLQVIGEHVKVHHFVFDGAFGYNDAVQMVRQLG